MADITLQSLSAAERNTVTGLKRQVTGLAEKLGVVRETASELAPRIMKLYNSLAAKYADLGGFVGFARLFDTDMPTHAADKDGVKGYRNNRTYQALDYMRRTLRLSNRPRGQQGKRDPAVDQLARTLATVMQVIRGDNDRNIVWQGIATEFTLSERAISRLKVRVDNARPLLDLSQIRPVAIRASNVVHVNRQQFADEGANEEQAGMRRVRRERRIAA